MPRAANCSSSSSRPPGWSSRWKRTTDVLSAPVGAGSSPGLATSTNRVTAPLLSPMSSCSTVSPWFVAATGAQTAAWYAGRRGGGCGGQVLHVRKVCPHPSAHLCPGVRMGRHRADVGERDTHWCSQDEGDRDDLFADHDERFPTGQGVQRGTDPAFDGVLDRHHCGF